MMLSMTVLTNSIRSDSFRSFGEIGLWLLPLRLFSPVQSVPGNQPDLRKYAALTFIAGTKSPEREKRALSLYATLVKHPVFPVVCAERIGGFQGSALYSAAPPRIFHKFRNAAAAPRIIPFKQQLAVKKYLNMTVSFPPALDSGGCFYFPVSAESSVLQDTRELFFHTMRLSWE